jgi:ATP/maltotriose-dependent transcriptional regulator MalT
VRTLIAPAGYGKTTLAGQWVERDGRRHAWFTARRSSTDVAALALGVARACTVLVPECDVRLREHLRAVPSSADNSDLLAEILGEDLHDWPTDAWLVIDDYHEIARGAEAERFVAALITSAPVQLLIASRQRPSWVTTRGVLYGEFFELNQMALAMETAEAAEVLADETGQSASGLVAVANGWPAVIGLASVSGAELDHDVEQVPESLYSFFAEEVYAALDEDVKRGLATLATAPVLDRDLAVRLLGSDLAAKTCAAGVDMALIAERGTHLELHPLCRSFLTDRGPQLSAAIEEGAARECLAHYEEGRDWDAAFDLVARHGPVERLPSLLSNALDELLEAARLSTIEAWCEVAASEHVALPIVCVARAEVTVRRGRFTEAQAHAEAAAESDSHLRFRAIALAARAAHLASREAEARELYQRAESAASSDTDLRDALWGQFICAVELELPEAHEMFRTLRADVKHSDTREVVRAAAYELHYGLKMATLDLTEADRVAELLDSVNDALLISSFQNIYSVMLGLSARYSESLMMAERLESTARKYRLDFAVPHALSAKALAWAGLRKWGEAQAALERSIGFSTARRDVYAHQVAFSLLVRLFVQQGRSDLALAIEVPTLRNAVKSAQAEVTACRALALATAGRVRDAKRSVEGVRQLSRGVEPRTLIASVDAVSAVRSRDGSALRRVVELEEIAFTTGALDILVTAYRSTPDLLGLLLKASIDRDRMAALVRRVGDADVAATVGQPVAADDPPERRLTRREREVYDLLMRGLTTQEIAQLLVISPATSKLHAHRIYEKFGVGSRSALLAQATLARPSQATSATANDDSSNESSLP